PVTRMAVSLELREMGWNEVEAFRALGAVRPELVRLDEALAAVETLHARKLRRYVAHACTETLRELHVARDVQAPVHRHEKAIIDLASRNDGADDFRRADQVSEERLERLETGIRELDEVSGG